MGNYKNVKEIKDTVVFVFVILFGLFVFALTIPILIVTFPFMYFDRKRFEKKYSEFLEENDNLNFFCYNTRKNSKEFIETEIIPNLSGDIEIIFLNGKTIENKKYPREFISKALFNLKNYSKFPHLMKIRKGKLIDKSINTLFYSIRNQNTPKDRLMREINNFFEMDEKNIS